jgi:hypothetical protein
MLIATEARPNMAPGLIAEATVAPPAAPQMLTPDDENDILARQTAADEPTVDQATTDDDRPVTVAIVEKTLASPSIQAIAANVTAEANVTPEADAKPAAASPKAAEPQPAKTLKPADAPLSASGKRPVSRRSQTAEHAPENMPMAPVAGPAVAASVSPMQERNPSNDAPVQAAPASVTATPAMPEVASLTSAAEVPAAVVSNAPAEPIPPEIAAQDTALQSPRLDAKPQAVPSRHHAGHSKTAKHSQSDSTTITATSAGSSSDTPQVAEQPSAASLPDAITQSPPAMTPAPLAATTTTRTRFEDQARTRPATDPVLSSPTSPAVVVATSAPLPEVAKSQPANAQMPSATSTVAHTSQRAVAASRAANVEAQTGSPATAPSASQPATTTIATRPLPTAASVTFVARATPSVTAPTVALQPADSAAPAAKPDSVNAPPVAPIATAGRDALPFQTTARQILASQPATTDAPRAIDAETRVRTPDTDVQPTIAQHLLPAGHGERIPAAAAPASTPALSTEQAAALVETIQMLRSEAKSDAMTLAVDHQELGRITLSFDRTDHGVAVRFDSADPSVTQLIANSTPTLKSSGDSVGMRFERQDISGGSAGTSRDTPRQGAGQDRNPTPYAQPSRPRASGQRDGLFA